MQNRMVSRVAGISPRRRQGPKNYEGQDGYVHAGNYQDVISTGALEIDAGVAVDEGFFADDHGVDERGLRRRPERMDLGNDARVKAGSQEFDFVAGEAGENFDVFLFCRAQG